MKEIKDQMRHTVVVQVLTRIEIIIPRTARILMETIGMKVGKMNVQVLMEIVTRTGRIEDLPHMVEITVMKIGTAVTILTMPTIMKIGVEDMILTGIHKEVVLTLTGMTNMKIHKEAVLTLTGMIVIVILKEVIIQTPMAMNVSGNHKETAIPPMATIVMKIHKELIQVHTTMTDMAIMIRIIPLIEIPARIQMIVTTVMKEARDVHQIQMIVQEIQEEAVRLQAIMIPILRADHVQPPHPAPQVQELQEKALLLPHVVHLQEPANHLLQEINQQAAVLQLHPHLVENEKAAQTAKFTKATIAGEKLPAIVFL